jgi:hypothetical protein
MNWEECSRGPCVPSFEEGSAAPIKEKLRYLRLGAGGGGRTHDLPSKTDLPAAPCLR